MSTIDSMADTFKLLGDKTRLTILGLLKERDLCVCNIVDMLNLSQPSISQHLRKMKTGGLLNEYRKGKWVYYSLNIEDKPYVRGIIGSLPSQADRIQQFEHQLVCE